MHDNNGLGLWCDIDCRNVVYEENLVENNQYSGIFHEISFKAVIRNNVLRNNGSGDRGWFWGADITIAASQDVEVTGNTVTVAPGGCGIMLIDQGRRSGDGKKYKTRNNTVHANEMTFEGAACAGGVSDTKPDDENFAIITDGNNRFDGNTYRVRPQERTGPLRVGARRHRLGRVPAQRPGTERSPRPVLTTVCRSPACRSHMFAVICREALRQTRLLPNFAGSDRAMLTELALLGRFRSVSERLFLKRFYAGGS